MTEGRVQARSTCATCGGTLPEFPAYTVTDDVVTGPFCDAHAVLHDAGMTPDQALIAVTIRKIATHWCGEDEALQADLYGLSDEVERENLADSMCCPICQEVTCDEDCPLAGRRDV